MSANFTPSQQAIKNMQPFRFWCQKVLPTVYDDSLSYYELLNKVIIYLNETVDNVDTLNSNVQNIYNAYVLLQSYVNDYFDNEFPQLVVDKLDEMAEDGTLTALISGYIDPLFEAKTDEIDGIIEQQNNTISNAISQQNSTISNAIATQNNTISEAIEEQDSDISLLQTRMNNFINNHAGLVGEETIWEGNTPLSTENASITLDNPVSDYAFIDIYYNHRGKRAVQRFQTADVLDANGFYVRDAETERAPGGTPQLYPYFRILQYKLVHSTNNGSVLTLAEASESVWDGDVTSYPTTAISPATSSITKVVGVNMVQTDSEVADARVAEDGTVYPNLEARLNSEFTDLRSAIGQGGSFNTAVKIALDQFTASVLQLAEKVAYIDENGQDYYDAIDASADALHSAMYPPVGLSYITAVYTQSGTVYTTDTLDSLKDDLVVTAHYDNGTTESVTDYILTGTLTVGTSTITVSYGGKTTTFSVTVTERGALYPLENGTWYSENENPVYQITVSNGKHVRFESLRGVSEQAFANLHDGGISASADVVNNLPELFVIPANTETTLTISNVVNSGGVSFNCNFRKANASTSSSFGIGDGTHTDGATVTQTLQSDESVSCLFFYHTQAVAVAGSVIEFDVSLYVGGTKYI